MIRRLKTPALAAVLTCILPTLALPSDGSAEALLREVSKAYAELSRFSFEAAEVTVTRSGDLERRNETRTLTAAGDAGRFRVESDHRVEGGVIAFDGETTWIYVARRRQYKQIHGALLTGSPESPGLIRLKNRFVDRYKSITERLRDARLLPPETLEVDGREIECRVVEASYDAPRGLAAKQIVRRFWIAADRPLIYRESSQFEAKHPASGQTTTVSQDIEFRSVQVGDDVSQGVFAPRLPEDAKLVSDFDNAPGSTALIGQSAVSFEEHDLIGNLHRSSDLAGKVVLLDFWATWCLPCRVDLPRIESLHREFAAQGLEVFGVNDEAAEKARAFVDERGFTFPTLTDSAGALYRGYEVRTIPTAVIIGRDGKVSSYLAGSHSAEELRRAIREAGIE